MAIPWGKWAAVWLPSPTQLYLLRRGAAGGSEKEEETPDAERKEVGATRAMLRAENETRNSGDLEQKHEASELQMQQQTAPC